MMQKASLPRVRIPLSAFSVVFVSGFARLTYHKSGAFFMVIFYL
jgi:hypothetical protein